MTSLCTFRDICMNNDDKYRINPSFLVAFLSLVSRYRKGSTKVRLCQATHRDIFG